MKNYQKGDIVKFKCDITTNPCIGCISSINGDTAWMEIILSGDKWCTTTATKTCYERLDWLEKYKIPLTKEEKVEVLKYLFTKGGKKNGR